MHLYFLCSVYFLLLLLFSCSSSRVILLQYLASPCFGCSLQGSPQQILCLHLTLSPAPSSSFLNIQHPLPTLSTLSALHMCKPTQLCLSKVLYLSSSFDVLFSNFVHPVHYQWKSSALPPPQFLVFFKNIILELFAFITVMSRQKSRERVGGMIASG